MPVDWDIINDICHDTFRGSANGLQCLKDGAPQPHKPQIVEVMAFTHSYILVSTQRVKLCFVCLGSHVFVLGGLQFPSTQKSKTFSVRVYYE